MTVVERKRLHAEIWQRPVGVISRDYGVPAAKVREACKVLSVPLPPARYWADKRAGNDSAPIPLPAHAGPDVFQLRAEPKESLVEWVMKNAPHAVSPPPKPEPRKGTPAPINPRYVPLTVWATQVFGDHCPHNNTLLKWVHEGRIQPQPKKIGRGWFLVPHAEYVSD
jgi:hypothetical protein